MLKNKPLNFFRFITILIMSISISNIFYAKNHPCCKPNLSNHSKKHMHKIEKKTTYCACHYYTNTKSIKNCLPQIDKKFLQAYSYKTKASIEQLPASIKNYFFTKKIQKIKKLFQTKFKKQILHNISKIVIICWILFIHNQIPQEFINN